VVEISGKPVREIVRQPGGPLTKLHPNGQYMVEQMYVQFFLPKECKGKPINLPEIGIKGNSHMLVQDKNNAEIADVIQKSLVGKGLVD
jgi:hypothetical protein